MDSSTQDLKTMKRAFGRSGRMLLAGCLSWVMASGPGFAEHRKAEILHLQGGDLSSEISLCPSEVDSRRQQYQRIIEQKEIFLLPDGTAAFLKQGKARPSAEERRKGLFGEDGELGPVAGAFFGVVLSFIGPYIGKEVAREAIAPRLKKNIPFLKDVGKKSDVFDAIAAAKSGYIDPPEVMKDTKISTAGRFRKLFWEAIPKNNLLNLIFLQILTDLGEGFANLLVSFALEQAGLDVGAQPFDVLPLSESQETPFYAVEGARATMIYGQIQDHGFLAYCGDAKGAALHSGEEVVPPKGRAAKVRDTAVTHLLSFSSRLAESFGAQMVNIGANAAFYATVKAEAGAEKTDHGHFKQEYKQGWGAWTGGHLLKMSLALFRKKLGSKWLEKPAMKYYRTYFPEFTVTPPSSQPLGIWLDMDNRYRYVYEG
ncbi:MAG: hypothetical protein H6618_01010 [Deltaproteobacteria bacterium]|nr:hypothetical protein [Deltaproteobacteria bacterium]